MDKRVIIPVFGGPFDGAFISVKNLKMSYTLYDETPIGDLKRRVASYVLSVDHKLVHVPGKIKFYDERIAIKVTGELI